MQKIVPHLWFNKEAPEAVAFYITLFPNSKITDTATIQDTPSGDCDFLNFTLAGQQFMAISGGPYFEKNPAVSMFVVFDNEAEIKATWDKLIEGGKALMPYDTYPWAKKYGWVEDRYGLTWQLSLSDNHKLGQKITPLLMFTQDLSGKAKSAIEHYTSIFPDSKIDMVATYEKGEGDTEGFIKHARFTLAGQQFMAMDSSGPHKFKFNEGVSLLVSCETQKEIDYYWDRLSAVPESEQCGWLKDKFGVSWQVSPSAMIKILGSGDKAKIARAMKVFGGMKKVDLGKLEEAARG